MIGLRSGRRWKCSEVSLVFWGHIPLDTFPNLGTSSRRAMAKEHRLLGWGKKVGIQGQQRKTSHTLDWDPKDYNPRS